MEVNIYDSYEKMSAETADMMIRLLLAKPAVVFCLASGGTPVLAYKLFTEEVNQRNIDCSKMTIIGLDEWIGIDKQNEGSCYFFFHKHILKKLSLVEDQYHFFDGLTKNPQEECESMNDYISFKKGIDLMIVGIGMNGHIGFNEPGISFDKYSHVARLDETTRTVGQKYFSSKTDLKYGITLGLQHVMEARQVMMLANGESKAKVIQSMLNFPASPRVPASILKKHDSSVLMLDREAASLL